MKVVLGRWASSAAITAVASKRSITTDAPTPEQGGGGQSDGDRVVHGRAHQMGVAPAVLPQVGLVVEQRTGRGLVEHARPHALGPARRPRRVVHGAYEWERRQLGGGPVEECRQPGVVADHQGGVGVGDENVALGGEQGGVQHDGDDPRRAAPNTAHNSPADEGRQNATRPPGSRPARTRAPPTRRWAPSASSASSTSSAGVLTAWSPPPVHGCGHGGAGAGASSNAACSAARAGGAEPGTVAPGGTSPPSSTAKTRLRVSPMTAMTATRRTPDAVVTARIPDAVGDGTLEHRTDGVDGPQGHHVEAEHAPPGDGGCPALHHGVEAGEDADITRPHQRHGGDRRPQRARHPVGDERQGEGEEGADHDSTVRSAPPAA